GRLSAGTADPGRSPPTAIPVRVGDYIVAVAQGGDPVVAHPITRATADKAIGFGDGAADPRRAAAPRHRPPVAAPRRAPDRVAADAQRDGRIVADLITGATADEAIGSGDGPIDPRAAAAPRHRAAIAAPRRAPDQVVAVGQGSDEPGAHKTILRGPHQAVGV